MGSEEEGSREGEAHSEGVADTVEATENVASDVAECVGALPPSLSVPSITLSVDGPPPNSMARYVIPAFGEGADVGSDSECSDCDASPEVVQGETLSTALTQMSPTSSAQLGGSSMGQVGGTSLSGTKTEGGDAPLSLPLVPNRYTRMSQPLHEAAAKADSTTLSDLLSKGYNPFARDSSNRTALHCLLQSKLGGSDSAMASALLDEMARVADRLFAGSKVEDDGWRDLAPVSLLKTQPPLPSHSSCGMRGVGGVGVVAGMTLDEPNGAVGLGGFSKLVPVPPSVDTTSHGTQMDIDMGMETGGKKHTFADLHATTYNQSGSMASLPVSGMVSAMPGPPMGTLSHTAMGGASHTAMGGGMGGVGQMQQSLGVPRQTFPQYQQSLPMHPMGQRVGMGMGGPMQTHMGDMGDGSLSGPMGGVASGAVGLPVTPVPASLVSRIIDALPLRDSLAVCGVDKALQKVSTESLARRDVLDFSDTPHVSSASILNLCSMCPQCRVVVLDGCVNLDDSTALKVIRLLETVQEISLCHTPVTPSLIRPLVEELTKRVRVTPVRRLAIVGTELVHPLMFTALRASPVLPLLDCLDIEFVGWGGSMHDERGPSYNASVSVAKEGEIERAMARERRSCIPFPAPASIDRCRATFHPVPLSANSLRSPSGKDTQSPTTPTPLPPQPDAHAYPKFGQLFSRYAGCRDVADLEDRIGCTQTVSGADHSASLSLPLHTLPPHIRVDSTMGQTGASPSTSGLSDQGTVESLAQAMLRTVPSCRKCSLGVLLPSSALAQRSHPVTAAVLADTVHPVSVRERVTLYGSACTSLQIVHRNAPSLTHVALIQVPTVGGTTIENILKTCPRLTHLRVEGGNAIPGIFKNIVCPTLRSLSLSMCPWLGCSPSLSTSTLSIYPSGQDPNQSMQGGYMMHRNGMRVDKRRDRLPNQYLALSALLQCCPNLTELRLHGVQDVRAISRLPALSSLSVSFPDMPNAPCHALPPISFGVLPHTRSLELSNLSLVGVSPLTRTSHPTLRSLTLRNVKAQELEIRHGALSSLTVQMCPTMSRVSLSCPSLLSVSVSGCPRLSDMALMAAPSLHTLEMDTLPALGALSLTPLPPRVAALERYQRLLGASHTVLLPGLSRLSLVSCPRLSSASVAKVVGATSHLTHLCLRETRVRAEDLSQMPMPDLASLTYTGGRGVDCDSSLAFVLSSIRRLSSLSLRETEIGAQTLSALLQKHAPSLASIDIGSCSTMAAGPLAELVLGADKALRRLILPLPTDYTAGDGDHATQSLVKAVTGALPHLDYLSVTTSQGATRYSLFRPYGSVPGVDTQAEHALRTIVHEAATRTPSAPTPPETDKGERERERETEAEGRSRGWGPDPSGAFPAPPAPRAKRGMGPPPLVGADTKATLGQP
ncbi:hypothetical protein KIPB_001727 [Kipferlia bialata]|uniref:F-box domain-containing protein n=1 Tax=Kipferlia bialata TaxID=797122 RepID=A0A9K3CRE7_9EUKA|nr:hypothetical protein KIPB_001727 [Kipferlia bialata]|eukprot:g1727.t1